jgi:hypothetical protein
MKIQASWFGNAAQWTSAILAFVALIAVAYQINLSIANNAVNSARQVYMSYSEATLTYPDYVEPNYEELKKDPRKLAQYKSYVAHLLFAFDEVFSTTDTPEWRATFDYDLAPHIAYLCEERDPHFYAMYYPKMRRMLEGVKATNCLRVQGGAAPAPSEEESGAPAK